MREVFKVIGASVFALSFAFNGQGAMKAGQDSHVAPVCMPALEFTPAVRGVTVVGNVDMGKLVATAQRRRFAADARIPSRKTTSSRNIFNET